MTLVEYVTCPLCGSNHPWSSEARRVRRGTPYWSWVDYDLERFEFIQIRDARGKVPGRHPDRRGRGSAPGQGIPKVNAMYLQDILSHPVYRNTLESMKERLLTILRQLYEMNIVSREEIENIIR